MAAMVLSQVCSPEVLLADMGYKRRGNQEGIPNKKWKTLPCAFVVQSSHAAMTLLWNTTEFYSALLYCLGVTAFKCSG